MTNRDLIVCLPSGETMKFENVRNFQWLDKTIMFAYVGVATGKTRLANFLCDKLLGWAVSVDDDVEAGNVRNQE